MLDRVHFGAGVGLEAFAASNLRRETVERAADRNHFAETAAGVGVARP